MIGIRKSKVRMVPTVKKKLPIIQGSSDEKFAFKVINKMYSNADGFKSKNERKKILFSQRQDKKQFILQVFMMK